MKLGFPFPSRNARKKMYKPFKLRLLEGKASFRKWEQCVTDGTEYTYEEEEDLASYRHESDEEDPCLEKRDNDDDDYDRCAHRYYQNCR